MRASTLAPTCRRAHSGQKYEYVFKKSQAVSTATRAGGYYFAVKFKRYLNSVDKVCRTFVIDKHEDKRE